jgi:hypothetical protein
MSKCKTGDIHLYDYAMKQGCDKCRYCDQEALKQMKPCCTYAFKLEIDEFGKCKIKQPIKRRR